MKNYFFSLVALLITTATSAQLSPDSRDIPMRDGKYLAADFYSNDSTVQKPTILIMTPYGKFFYTIIGLPFDIGYDFSKSNYNFVIVDWRGRFASSGAFAIDSDNGEDGYDVVEWIAAQSWSDGKIGTWGPSALGGVQFDLAKEKPPHLTCCVPEVAAPIYEYSHYHPGGVLETATYRTLNEKLYQGSYTLVIQNPYYNLLWQVVEQSTTYPEEIEVPMLLIGGWFDHNIEQDIRLIDMLSQSSPMSVRDEHKILIGPWVHGGSGPASLGTTAQGDLSFPLAEKWNDSLSMVFFDYYLRDIPNGWENRKRYTYFNMGERKWKNEDVWPPLSNKDHTYYLSDGEGLYTDQRTDKTFSYMYDPNDPSPTIGGKNLHDDLDQGPYDLTDSVESRGDVVIFTTEALESNLSVKGKIEVKLYVSSDRKDTDFAIRLSEVYSDGRSILLLDGIQRMRFRDGFAPSDTSAMNPGTVYPITIVLDDISNTFLKGNKIRLIVSSSNYPRYNRNMNTNGEMYPDDNPDTLVNPLVASNTIYTGTTYPSQIIFPVDTSDAAEIQVISSDNTISVYPNPSSGKFMITGAPNNSKFQVYNVSGQLVIESNNPRISMEDFEPGTYLIKIQSDDKTFTKKIIIQ